MKTLNKKLCLILSVLAVLCFGIMALVTFAPVQASAAVEGFTTTDFKMLDKGSIRKDVANNGIRFATFIGDESQQASYNYETDYELGTLFMPKALLGNEALELDKTYGGKSPAKVEFDGDMTKLTTDATYTGGKLFNAVLDLSAYTANADALNGVMVARTYVKKLSDNSVTYCDAVERAPAYVAAMAIEANEEDTNNTLATYVGKVEIVAPANFNLGAWSEAVEGPKTNVEGIPVTYSVSKGKPTQYGLFGGSMLETDLAKVTDDGKLEGLGEGDITLTVSALKGALTKAVPTTVTFPQVAWYGGEFNAADNYFTIKCKNVKDVKVNGVTLDKAKWTYTETVDHDVYNADRKYMPLEYILTIKKSDVLGTNINVQGDYAITLVTNDGYEFDIPVYVREAVELKPNSDKSNNANIKLMFLEARVNQFNLAASYFREDGSLVIPCLGQNYGRINVSAEYMHAFFGKYKTSDTIQCKWTALNDTDSTTRIKANYKVWSKTTNKSSGYGISSGNGLTPNNYTWNDIYQGMLYNGDVKYATERAAADQWMGDSTNDWIIFDPGTGVAAGRASAFVIASAYKAGTYVAYVPAA